MGAEPYTDVATHVRDELRRAWLRLEYQIRLGWRKADRASPAKTSSGPRTWAGCSPPRAARPRPTTTAAPRQVLEQWLAVHAQIEARIRATIERAARVAARRPDPHVRPDAAPVVDADVRAAARGRSEPRARLSLPRARLDLPRARRPAARAARLRHAADALADGARSVGELAAAALSPASTWRAARRRPTR